MKQTQLSIYILPLFLLAISCNAPKPKQAQEPKQSIEVCHEYNLKNSTLITGWYYVMETDSGFSRQLDKSDETFVLHPRPIVTAEDISELRITKNNMRLDMLQMWFGERGTAAWAEATRKATGSKVAFVVNNKLTSTPLVNSEITTSVSALVREVYSKTDLENFKTAFENNRKEMNEAKEGEWTIESVPNWTRYAIAPITCAKENHL